MGWLIQYSPIEGSSVKPFTPRRVAYTSMVDERAAGTPWLTGGCRNWYVDERSRRLTLVWPGTVADYRAALAASAGTEFETAQPLAARAVGSAGERSGT